MKVIKSLEDHKIEVPFEGQTYVLEAHKAVSLDQKVYDFLKERFPLAFDFEFIPEKNKPVALVKKYKSKVYFANPQYQESVGTEDMRVLNPNPVPTFGAVDQLPASGTTDKDGVSWYGEGEVIEGGSNG